MLPVLLNIPAWILLLLGGAIGGVLITAGAQGRKWVPPVAGLLGALLALGIGSWQGWIGERWPLRGYGVMITIGFLLSLWMARRRAILLGISPTHVLDVGLWGLVGGVAGARLFHVIQNWSEYAGKGPGDPSDYAGIFRIWEGGLVFYGAFGPAIIIATVYCWYHKIPTLPFLDMASPSLIIGQAFGRVGCFLFGCCYGRVCTSPWSVQFPEKSSAYDYATSQQFLTNSGMVVPGLHPTQLYASFGALVTSLFLYHYWPRRRFDGQIFGLMLLMAAATRFFEEFLRADTLAPAWGPFATLVPSFSVAQWIALALISMGVLWLTITQRRNQLYVPDEDTH